MMPLRSREGFLVLVRVAAEIGPAELMAAGSRTGALGVCALGCDVRPAEVAALAASFREAGVTRFGLQFASVDDCGMLVEAAGEGLSAVVLPVASLSEPGVAGFRGRGIRVYAEVSGWTDVLRALEPHLDGYVLKGHECGGIVGEQTTFILLQEFRRRTGLPLLARGGITPETAAAARVAGAAGVVLDEEVLLLAESPLPDSWFRARLAACSGAETALIEDARGARYLRLLERPGSAAAAGLSQRVASGAESLDSVAARLEWNGPDGVPAGQSVGLAAGLARRHRTLGRLVGAIRRAADRLPAQAAERRALAPGGPLASALGTDYPILQGPMTRVSDVAPFTARVAEAGALPFAALALLRGPAVESLLGEIAGALGDRPWGVGLLGFAHTEILREQLAVVEKYRPKFAILAGARVNQVMAFEAKGIRTYVHASTPGILSYYLGEGVRRFILEGRECGGHVGPLSSFVLWASIVATLRDHPVVAREAGSIELVFAGGIHDPVSAAMVATLAEPLAAKGVRIGVLMGTAYLFTREIVESGAIVPDYQEVAVACAETLTLSEGGGFASRCAVTPIADAFRGHRRALEEAGASAREVREEMETYSLGRLRMATKGVARVGPEKTLTEIDPDRRRAEGMYMIGQAATMRDRVGSLAELHESVTTAALDHLAEVGRAPAAEAVAVAPAPADIAIVGIATLLPGADSAGAFWRRILSGQSAIREIPEDRWNPAVHFSEDRTERDKVYSRRGGFIDDVAFNPLAYGIPPASLPSIDPMQLLALELVSDVLADADIRPEDEVDRSRISTVFGFSGGAGELGAQYIARSELPRLIGRPPEDVLARLPEWTEDSFAGILPNVTAGRIANRFDFGGTNQVVDAACASSLAAVYAAVLELESGRADMVIAGGLDTLQSPFGYLCFSKTQALSPRGVCNPLDAAADGIVISEGLAAVALKRLSDAERDGDRIYAVIKGVGASSDGRAKGLTAPLPTGQKRALRRAYAQAGFAPATVQLFEAHGTGTAAGDRAELETVTGLLEADGAPPRSAAIGSVKALIGHTKAAAGVSGLIKAALGLHHRVLPPHALVTTPNAALSDEASPLYLSQAPRPWVRPAGQPRRAGVSSFGFGGTNFHVALEEYGRRPPARASVDLGRDLVPLAFAAGTPAELGQRLRELDAAIAEGRVASPRAAAAFALSGGNGGPVRVGFTASSLDEVRARAGAALRLAEGGDAAPAPDVHFTDRPALAAGGRLAVLFPGQGSQYPDMLREAALLGPFLTEALDRAEEVLAATPTFAAGGRRLARLIYPGDAFTPDDRKAQAAALMATEIAQPALGAVEAGLIQLLADLGLRPDMVAGHSYGEFVALHAGGAIGFDDLIRLSEARGHAISECADPARPGAMAAVAADADATRAALGDIADVVLANFNSPRQTVIAGPRAAVEKASAAIAATGLKVQSVPVSQAFHSPLMAPARARFEAALAEVDWRAPALPVYGNTHARPHGQDPAAIRAVMSEHLVSPVEFAGMVRAMAADGARAWLELGPKAVLSGRVQEILGDAAGPVVAIDRAAGDAGSLLDALVRLFVEGAPVDLGRLVGRLAAVSPRPATADPKTGWLVNGAYARKAGSTRRRQDPVVAAVCDTPAEPSDSPVAAPDFLPEGGPHPHPPSLPAAFRQELQFMPATKDDLLWSDPPGHDGQDVLAGYHRMMREFLQVQERVMLTYLARDGAGQHAYAAPFAPATEFAPPAIQVEESRPAPVVSQALAPASANGTERLAAAAVIAAPATAAPRPEPVAVPAPVVAGPIDLLAVFTKVVADKTGYPPDSLGPEQDLEADLGIDSIKRMEILGAFQKALPQGIAEALRADMDAIAEISTIRAIVDHVAKKAMNGSHTVPETVVEKEIARPFDLAGEATEVATTLPRFIQVAFEEPLDGVPLIPPIGRRFAVTEAPDGFHGEVAAALAGAGASVVVIPRAVLDAGEPGAIAEWLAGLDAAPEGLVYLDGRACLPPLGSLDLAGWRAIHAAGIKRLFRLLQAMAPRLRDGGRFVAVTETGGLFGRGPAGVDAGVSAVAGAIGMVRTLTLEWPGCGSKAIDLDPAEGGSARAGHVLAELSLDAGRREVGYPGGRRTIFRTEPHSLMPPARPPAIGSDWVVVATGGARGITAECLRTLAPHRPTLVLVGRSALPGPEAPETARLDAAGLRRHYLERARAAGGTIRPKSVEADVRRHLGERDIRQNLRDLAAMGARIEYRSVDVCDPGQVQALFDDLYVRHGRVDMVVHGAGLIEDAWLEKKTPESFERVFDTKVDSAFLIARALRPESLKALCFFTSVAGRYGNPGQADYAAANETLNRLAWQLKRDLGETVIVKAINWGPWAETTTGAGMVTPEVRRQFESRGIGMVEALPGRDLFFKELFWADPAEIETVAWAADAEEMEERRCALPAPADAGFVGEAGILLSRARRRSNGHRELLWRFDLVNAPYVDHHRFDGVAVMPFAAVLQMMSEVPAAFGIEKPVVALEDVRMNQGLTLKDGPRELCFVVEDADEGRALKVAVFSDASANRPHYRGLVRFGDRVPASQLRLPEGGRHAWSGRDTTWLYRHWLSHGPRYQTLRRIVELDASGVRAHAVASRPADFIAAGAGRSWTFDPALLDGALQAVWVWTRSIQETSALPLRVAAVRRFAADPAGPFVIDTDVLTAPEERDVEFTTRLFDASGRLFLEIERLHARASEMLNRLGGGWQGGERPKVAADEVVA